MALTLTPFTGVVMQQICLSRASFTCMRAQGLEDLIKHRIKLSLWTRNTYVTVSCYADSTRRGRLILSRDRPMVCEARHFSLQNLAYLYSPEFPPVYYAHKTLTMAHDVIGMPWWVSILATTVVLRTVLTLPLGVYSQYIMGKVRALMPEIAAKGKELKGEVAFAMKQYKWDAKHAHHQYVVNMRRIIKEMYIRDNCHPFKASLVAWVQLPVWVGMSLALRNMSGRTPFNTVAFEGVLRPDLASEGALWFTNFMVPDATLILPLTCGLVNLFIIEMNVIGQTNPSRMQRYGVNFMRFTSLIMVPIGAVVPSCMVYYWTCSSFYGLGQNVLLQYPKVRRAFGIPRLDNESDTPMRDKWRLLKTKLSRKSKDKKDSDNSSSS